MTLPIALSEANLRLHDKTVGLTAMLSRRNYSWADDSYVGTASSGPTNTNTTGGAMSSVVKAEQPKRLGAAKRKREQLKRKGVRLGVTEMYAGVV